jgi:hypothetical protein
MNYLQNVLFSVAGTEMIEQVPWLYENGDYSLLTPAGVVPQSWISKGPQLFRQLLFFRFVAYYASSQLLLGKKQNEPLSLTYKI